MTSSYAVFDQMGKIAPELVAWKHMACLCQLSHSSARNTARRIILQYACLLSFADSSTAQRQGSRRTASASEATALEARRCGSRAQTIVRALAESATGRAGVPLGIHSSTEVSTAASQQFE